MTRLSSHTPPKEASTSAACCWYWLAPSSPQGPPRYCQERMVSITIQPQGTSTIAATARSVSGRPRSSRHTSQPQGAQNSPSSAASSRIATLRVGMSQLITPIRKPMPPYQPSFSARRWFGAARSTSISGTRHT